MAILDLSERLLTIRVAYDGSGLAGKSTTLRSLAGHLGRGVDTPGESLGRTMYFDWMDFRLEAWHDLRVCCQVITVPGQAGLAERRRFLLRGADAIVFTFDSSAARLAENMASLSDLVKVLKGMDPPAPALLVQANKRDVEDALPMQEVRDLLSELPGVPVLETVASEGKGVREAFAAAVGRALDRAKTLAEAGVLTLGRTRIHRSMGLIEDLLDAEARGPASESAFGDEDPALLKALRREIAARGGKKGNKGNKGRAPEPVDPSQDRAPLPDLPPGSVWPVPQGAGFLREVLAAKGGKLASGAGGSTVRRGRWRLRTFGRETFDSAQAAAEGLRELVRPWQRHRRRLSSDRFIAALPDPGGDSWRIWQAVADQTSLRDLAVDELPGEDDRLRVLWWLHLGTALLMAGQSDSPSAPSLPWNIRTLGLEASLPVFIDLLPKAGVVHPPMDPARELKRLVAEALARQRSAEGELLEALRSLRLGNETMVEAARVLDAFLSGTFDEGQPHHGTLELL